GGALQNPAYRLADALRYPRGCLENEGSGVNAPDPSPTRPRAFSLIISRALVSNVQQGGRGPRSHDSWIDHEPFLEPPDARFAPLCSRRTAAHGGSGQTQHQ